MSERDMVLSLQTVDSEISNEEIEGRAPITLLTLTTTLALSTLSNDCSAISIRCGK